MPMERRPTGGRGAHNVRTPLRIGLGPQWEPGDNTRPQRPLIPRPSNQNMDPMPQEMPQGQQPGHNPLETLYILQRQDSGTQYHVCPGFNDSSTFPTIDPGLPHGYVAHVDAGGTGHSISTPHDYTSLDAFQPANALTQRPPSHDTLIAAGRAVWPRQVQQPYQMAIRPPDSGFPSFAQRNEQLASPMAPFVVEAQPYARSRNAQGLKEVAPSTDSRMTPRVYSNPPEGPRMNSHGRHPTLSTIPEYTTLQTSPFPEFKDLNYEYRDPPWPCEDFRARMLPFQVLPSNDTQRSTTISPNIRPPMSSEKNVVEPKDFQPTNDRLRQAHDRPLNKGLESTQDEGHLLQIPDPRSSQGSLQGSSQDSSQGSSWGSRGSMEGATSSHRKRKRSLTKEQREHARKVRKEGACKECRDRKVQVRFVKIENKPFN